MAIRSFLALTLLLAPVAHATSSSEGEVLKWTGCGITKLAFMSEAAKAYTAETGVEIQLSGGGATKGIRFVQTGMSDLGGCCRPALSQQFPEEEGHVFLTVVAWDALVPIVHPENPIASLTSDQLRGILSGEITRWSELGGEDVAIELVVRDGTISGVGAMTRRILFADPDKTYATTAEVVKSSGPAEKAVESGKHAITVTGISSAKRRNVKVLALEGVEPTVENIASGEYGLFRPLYIAHRLSGNMDQTRRFLDWLTSDAGQAIVESCGTVSLRTGVRLVNRFQHWEDTQRITNWKALQQAAEAAGERVSATRSSAAPIGG